MNSLLVSSLYQNIPDNRDERAPILTLDLESIEQINNYNILR
jgi:hypothetical protein